jgi:hypothetical protein
LRFISVRGMATIAGIFDFIFLGRDFKLTTHVCMMHPPLCKKRIQSLWGLIKNSDTHYLLGFCWYLGSFAAFSMNLWKMFTPECKKTIFLKVTSSPGCRTTLTTGPSFPTM